MFPNDDASHQFLPVAIFLSMEACCCCLHLQHSIMARPASSARWKIIPSFLSAAPPCTAWARFVLFGWCGYGSQWAEWSGQWRAIQQRLSRQLLMQRDGWSNLSNFMINHFDLSFIRQVWDVYQGKKYEHSASSASVLQICNGIRYTWLVIVGSGNTPVMTAAHLLFVFSPPVIFSLLSSLKRMIL